MRIGTVDYEPSKVVQQVMMTTKLQQGSAHHGTPEEKERADRQKERWLADISNVDNLLKQITLAKNHKTHDTIRELAEKILADKSQIDKFMEFDKPKKMDKLKQYQTSVRQKLRYTEEQRKMHGHCLNKA